MENGAFLSFSEPNAPFQCIFYVNGLAFYKLVATFFKTNQCQVVASEIVGRLN